MLDKTLKTIKNRWLLILILALLITFKLSGLDAYLSFANLQRYQDKLIFWTNANYLITVVTYCFVYIISVAVSIPGAVILTLLGGLLFGNVLGTLYVVISATIGATLLFIAVKTAFADQITNRASSWVAKMQSGFQEDAFSYLLTLRLIPIFPFWVVNIVPALLGVKLKAYFIATFFGIIPGSAIYVAIGSGLGKTIANNQAPNLKIIFEPQILIPLIALGVIALSPILYKKYFKNKRCG